MSEETISRLKVVIKGDNSHSIICGNIGASRARNIGASSIPRYLRQSHVMFVDDDIYACPRWDETLLNVTSFGILSGHAHPYNCTTLADTPTHIFTNVISTVQMCMPWGIWDNVGWFTEPGGAGGSEDVDYCKRADEKKYVLMITKPHCFIHTGLHSSSGKPIVGMEQVVERNKQIERLYGLEGKVRYA